MATLLEESFVNVHLKSGTVFEFGPGNCAWALKLNPATYVLAVDLYPSEVTDLPSNITYKQCNLLDLSSIDRFDNIVCLSSFEHAGIEQPHFQNKQLDFDEHVKVANKLKSLVTSGGRVILTLPAGADELYVCKRTGETELFSGNTDFDWGFRTFTLDTIKKLFKGLNLIDAKAYLRNQEADYFDIGSWTEINPQYISNNYMEQNGLLCVTFESSIAVGDNNG